MDVLTNQEKLDNLKIKYDKLQLKYGAKELDSIYNGGCVYHPDICFVFMNPTGRNIASEKVGMEENLLGLEQRIFGNCFIQ